MSDDPTITRPPGSRPDPGTLSAPPDPLTASNGETPFDHPGGTAPEAAGGVLAGRYRLRELLGEGGMGSVWLADQLEPVRRAVAVKVIKRGLDSARVLARFEAERQALALMDHPHIARVLDGGATDRGQPFFVMEVVRGDTLTGFCDAHRLGTRERLELFAHICGAVQHAHQKGVIHRDLKPSNILVEAVDGKPVPKVIDFGLAKAVGGDPLGDRSAATAVGTVLGTPPYMAPEQATPGALDVDTRADVYALGAVLYELLTGTTPIAKERFARLPLDEAMRLVREEEPPTPSRRLSDTKSEERVTPPPPAVAPRVRHAPDLDWVVMKAIAKERERRYESASALAADVRRFLADEPVQARPPTAGYRLRKFVRRNKGAVIAGSLVLAAVAAGVVGTAVGLVEAQRQRDDANDARGREKEQRIEAETQAAAAKTQRDDATAARDVAMRAIDVTTSDLGEGVLTGQSVLSAEQRKYLDEVLGVYRDLAARKGDDADARRRVARAAYRVGAIEYVFDRLPEAERALRQAVDEFDALPTDDDRTDATRARINLGFALRANGQRKDATRVVSRAIEDLEAGTGDPAQVARRLLGAAYYVRGQVCMDLGQYAAADEWNRKAVAVQTKLAKEFPKADRYQLDLANTLNAAGLILKRLGRYADSRRAFLDALDRLPADSYTARRTECFVRNGFGSLLADHGRVSEALDQHRQAVAVAAAVALARPTPDARRNAGVMRVQLSVTLKTADRLADARAELTRAIEVFDRLNEETQPTAEHRGELAAALSNLGAVCSALDDLPAAEKHLTRARDLRAKLRDEFPDVPDHRKHLSGILYNLAQLADRKQRPADAVREHRAALDLRTKLAAEFADEPDYRQDVGASHNDLGYLFTRTGKTADARAHLTQAKEVREGLVTDHPQDPVYLTDLGGTYCNLGILAADEGRPKDGLDWYTKAIERLEAARETEPGFGLTTQYLRNTHQCRAVAYAKLTQFADGIYDWTRVIALTPAAEQGEPRIARMLWRANGGKLDEAVSDAEELSTQGGWKWNRWYDLATVFAVAAKRKGDAADKYAGRAVNCLEKSVAAGLKRYDLLTKDPTLDPLRGRSDFQKLLASVAPREVLPPPRADK